MSPVQQRALPYNLWSAVTWEKLKLKSWSHVKQKVACLRDKRRRIQESNKFHLFIFIGGQAFQCLSAKAHILSKSKTVETVSQLQKSFTFQSLQWISWNISYWICTLLLWYFILQSTKLSMSFPYNIGAESANLMPCHQGGVETHFLRHISGMG